MKTNKPILHARNHVDVEGDALSEIWWQGRQWAITSYGIERRDGTYAIEADRLGEDDVVSGVPDWPLHLAEKTGTDLPDFLTAFLVAMALHDVQVGPNSLKRAIADALNEAGR